MLFKNAHVFPVETDPFVGDVRVTGKKIAGIGVDL